MTTGLERPPANIAPIDENHVINQVTITVYATITLLGVVAAASLKKYATSEGELMAILIGASLAVSIAHFWSSLMAHRLVHHSMPSATELRREGQIVGSFFAVTGVTVGVVFVAGLVGKDFSTAVLAAEIVLIAALFVLGLAGALWAKTGWPKALAWGFLDASIGVVIVLVKLIVG
ncbi:MAG: hypothetical protein HQ526_06720 [Actinobacteria bacterium]|nr:hypothetical protein [Actinomycetota bacterium]